MCVLTGCEKKTEQAVENDAAVRVCVTDESGRPLARVEICVYTAGLYETFKSDVTVRPLATLRTNRRGEAFMKLDRQMWFATARVTEVYFAFVQYHSPQNYQYWSAGGTVGLGESRTFTIVAGRAETVPAEPDFHIENGVLTRYTGRTEGTVVLPAEVKEIGESCFAGTGIRQVELNEGLERIGAFAFYKSAVEEIKFPSSLKVLGEHAFEDCSRLAEADLSRTSLTEVSAAAFWGAGLTELLLPGTIRQIAAQAFLDTKGLRNVVLPETLLGIGVEAFRDSGLEKVQLPDNLQTLGDRAFYNCLQLKEVRSAGGAEACDGVVGVGCFENCLSLEAVELPQRIAEMEGWTFIGCDKLVAVTVPGQVTKIGYDGLDGGGIRIVTFRGLVPPSLDHSLPAYEDLEAIYVPAEALPAYQEKYAGYAEKIKPLE